jgi:hypothetical protein
MTWFLDLLREYFAPWANNPIAFTAAFVLGIFIGSFLSRTRHQGKIDTLEERLKLKDDLIKIKDDAIQGLNTQIEKPPSDHPMDRAPKRPDKSGLTYDAMPLELQIREALVSQKYLFVYNPQNGRNKILEFLNNGDIGGGRNANEWMWRIRDGKLEIINKKSEVFSRFRWNKDKDSFHHTNEPDTKSLRGQFLVPASSPEATKLQNLHTLTGKDPPYSEPAA